MHCRYIAISLAALAACASSAYAGDGEHGDFWRTARISIDADGKVTALDFGAPAGKRDIVGEKLDPVIRGWTFEPGRVNGKPAPTQTSLQLHMDMRKVDTDNFAVSLLSAETGVGWAVESTPAYPSEELKGGIEAQILFRIDFDAAGSPVKMAVENGVCTGSKWDTNAFIEAVDHEATSKWRFQTETVDGQGVAGSALVPVGFCIDGKASTCPILKDRLAKLRRGLGLPTPTDGPESLDAQAKLVTHVAGTTL